MFMIIGLFFDLVVRLAVMIQRIEVTGQRNDRDDFVGGLVTEVTVDHDNRAAFRCCQGRYRIRFLVCVEPDLLAQLFEHFFVKPVVELPARITGTHLNQVNMCVPARRRQITGFELCEKAGRKANVKDNQCKSCQVHGDTLNK